MFHFDALTELGAFMRTEFLCISVLRVTSGSRVKLASCKSALNPPVVYSTDRSKAVVPVLLLLFVVLWFILRGDLFRVSSPALLTSSFAAEISGIPSISLTPMDRGSKKSFCWPSHGGDSLFSLFSKNSCFVLSQSQNILR